MNKAAFVPLLSAHAMLIVAAQAALRPGPVGIEVIVKTIEREAIRGRLVAMSPRNGVLLHSNGEGERRVAIRDLVRITSRGNRAGPAAPTVSPYDVGAEGRTVRIPAPPGDTALLTLTGGDTLFGRVGKARDDSIVFETADLGDLAIPLDAVVRLDTPKASSPAYRDSARWLDHARPGDDDRIMLTNGDVIRGFITAIDVDGVSIDSAIGDTKVPYRLVVTVRLSPAAPHGRGGSAARAGSPSGAGGEDRTAHTADPALPHAIFTFRNSGRATVNDFDWSDNLVNARLRHGQRVRVEAERVVRVDIAGGRWEWLSSHRPISYEHTPMLSLDWEYAADRNVLGEHITVANETFERGVGVHSRSVLTYELKGIYREFVTSFGIDDHSGRYADVSAVILVDGKRRLDQAHVRRGELFGPVRLDVTNARTLELIADFGDNGDLQDRFNWVDAALIRAK